MCVPSASLPPLRLADIVVPANFRDWPACMRRRYLDHALGAGRSAER